jgi:CheY-like chemotaxis protein
MADCSLCFPDAKEQLEREMMDRQKRLIETQSRNELSAAEEELLENEIESRRLAIEKLDARDCCDFCGARVRIPESFRIRKYREKLHGQKFAAEKVSVKAECFDCRRKYNGQPHVERMIAGKDEIVRATEMLMPADRRKLQNKADWRVRGLGRASLGRTGDDLFQDAWLSTFTGCKRWNRGAIDFIGHLGFAMRNISYSWKKKLDKSEPYLEADIITCNARGDEVSPFESIQSREPAADERLGAKEEVERIFKKFRNDEHARAVLRKLLEGVTTAREIMQEQKLTRRQYEAAQRRIRSRKSALIIEEYDHVLELMDRWLKALDFAVVTARSADEGLGLYRDCGPYDIVIISYSPTVSGIELAVEILKKNPSQKMVITAAHCSERDVDLSQIAEVPVLSKPFLRNDFCTVLRTVLGNSANPGRERTTTCFKPKNPRGPALTASIRRHRQRVETPATRNHPAQIRC